MEVVSRWAKTLASKRGFPSAPARGQGEVCLYSSVFPLEILTNSKSQIQESEKEKSSTSQSQFQT
jgi:hypothetical protein